MSVIKFNKVTVGIPSVEDVYLWDTFIVKDITISIPSYKDIQKRLNLEAYKAMDVYCFLRDKALKEEACNIVKELIYKEISPDNLSIISFDDINYGE